MYGSLCDQYIEQGISVIPVSGKRVKILNFGQYSHRLPNEAEINFFKKLHGKRNIGLMLGPINNLMCIDIDTDDKWVSDMIESIAPVTPCEKFGSKGKTKFYRASLSKNEMLLTEDEGCVLEFLCTTKQTVIPPSKHPNKNKYVWLKAPLLDCLDDIPEIRQSQLDEISQEMSKHKKIIGFKEYLKLKSGVYK